MDLTNLLLFCDRIGDDQDYIMLDSRIIDRLLVDVDRATSAADGWDWARAHESYRLDIARVLPFRAARAFLLVDWPEY